MGISYPQRRMVPDINCLPPPSLSYFTGVIPAIRDPSHSIILRRRALIAAQGQSQMQVSAQGQTQTQVSAQGQTQMQVSAPEQPRSERSSEN